jgi:hypothetical protein
VNAVGLYGDTTVVDTDASATTSNVDAVIDGIHERLYRQAMTATHGGEPRPYLIALSIDGREVLSVDMSSGNQGWAAYFSTTVTDLGALVLVRLAPEALPVGSPPTTRGRTETAMEVKEVRVTAGQRAAGFASSLLREIPILRIEAAINQTAHRQVLTKRTPDGSLLTEDLPGGERFRIPPSKPRAMDRLSLSIDDPGGYRKPDGFYRQVADLYLHLAAVSARPAHDLAEANGTPVATVHRWIREAKARNILLLPAHRSGGDPAER